MKLKTPNLEAITGEALEDCRQPHARERKQLKRDAGPATGPKTCQDRSSVEALAPLRPLAPGGAAEAKHPGHVEDPDLDRAPGREAGEDAEEGHAAQVGEDAVTSSKATSIADKSPKSS